MHLIVFLLSLFGIGGVCDCREAEPALLTATTRPPTPSPKSPSQRLFLCLQSQGHIRNLDGKWGVCLFIFSIMILCTSLHEGGLGFFPPPLGGSQVAEDPNGYWLDNGPGATAAPGGLSKRGSKLWVAPGGLRLDREAPWMTGGHAVQTAVLMPDQASARTLVPPSLPQYQALFLGYGSSMLPPTSWYIQYRFTRMAPCFCNHLACKREQSQSSCMFIIFPL